jgi:ABC-type branched-subunit amino acid transport system substrate-binding protein
MVRRAFFILVSGLALSACSSYQSPLATAPLGMGGPGTVGPARTSQAVAILLPLSGPRADIGHAMLQAAQLALSGSGSPPLSAKDTQGTPAGATAAAQAAITEGVGIILGPLTSAETAAVAPVAQGAGVAVLAFTNDPSQAQPGVWTLGITPGQQVRRLVAAAQGQGKTEFAALLPENDLGRVMGDALTQATAAAGLPPPRIRTHGKGMAAITSATRDLSDYANRRGPVDAKIRAARALNTPEGRREAAELAKTPIPPPSFNALLLADTGDELAEIAAVLPYYDVDRGTVQIMGPAIWASPASGSGAVTGAWYAAPDPAARAGLEQAYAAKYGTPPPAIADLAFDAASIARVLASQGSYSAGALSQPAGYAGVDGWIGLLPDGQVRRGLAVFRIERGGPTMMEPAPQSAGGPGT